MSLSEVMNGIGMAYGWRIDVGLNALHGEVNYFEPFRILCCCGCRQG